MVDMDMKIKTLGIVLNQEKRSAATVLGRLEVLLRSLKIEAIVPASGADALPFAKPVPSQDLRSQVDAVLALGGDGTILHTAHLLNGAAVPILGVNLGSLGFLTSFTADQLEEALHGLVADQLPRVNRRVLACEKWRDDKLQSSHRALNDVVAGWGQSTRIVNIRVRINGEEVTTYRCDGLILSTPTGSTAHSLSAGGPIVHPDTPALLLNVICPHTLSARPMMIPDQCELAIEICETSKKLLLSVDGREEGSLEEGDRLAVRLSPQGVTLLQHPDHSYFGVLRHKLHWSGSTHTLRT